MRDRPDGAQLLALARELQALAPLLPAEQRVDPALVARAAGIAERERQAGDAPLQACHRALAALYGAGDFPALFERLARDIRAGAYDAPEAERDRVRRLLWAITLEKLSESNPDYLAASGIDPRSRNGPA
jgi:hypothetical protein